ncbi:uncharacterized protein LOC102708629 [Oryza brachyantha]|nr:uncharacterized protein LOC102708629 [Oryza brachyantha]
MRAGMEKSKVVKGTAPAQAAVAAAGDEARELPPGREHHLLPAPLQDMGEMDSQDKVIQESKQALLNQEGDLEAGGDQSNGLPVENRSAMSTARKENKRLMHHYLKLALLLITISTVPLIDILFLRGSALKLPDGLKCAVFFAFTGFVAAICLLFNTLKLMTIKPEHIIIPINQLRASIVLLATSISSLILTSISITCSLIPKAYYFLPISLLPSILAGVFHFIYRGKFEDRDVTPEKSKILKKALKSATQLTLSLVTTSFSGFIGDLLGIYHKTEKLGDQYSFVKVSIFLMLGAGVAGILALLLCRLLSKNGDQPAADDASGIWWQKTILASANIVTLAMLVPALLLIAATILHGLLLPAVVFPTAAGAAAWVFIEFFTAAGTDDDDGGRTEEDGKAELGTMYAISVAVASVSFGAILTVFGGLLGGTVGKGHLKVSTFFLASAFVSAVSLGVVASTAPARKASVAVAAAVLACCGMGTLVLAALALFYQIGA